MKHYYEILGLKDGATLEEVKEAFRKLSQTTHPDKGGSEYLFKIINGAYQKLLNYFKEGKSENTEVSFILIPSSDNKNIDTNKTVELICSEIFKIFKSLNYNIFTINIKLKYLMIVARKYNSLQLVLSNELHKIELSSVFKFNTAYDVCKYLCEQYGIDTNQKGFDAGIKQILIKIASKDIIDNNGGMAFNDLGNDSDLNQSEETIDIKDHEKYKDKKSTYTGPSNNKFRKMFPDNDYRVIDKNDISHTSLTDKVITFIIIIGLIGLLIKVLKIAII